MLQVCCSVCVGSMSVPNIDDDTEAQLVDWPEPELLFRPMILAEFGQFENDFLLWPALEDPRGIVIRKLAYR